MKKPASQSDAENVTKSIKRSPSQNTPENLVQYTQESDTQSKTETITKSPKESANQKCIIKLKKSTKKSTSQNQIENLKYTKESASQNQVENVTRPPTEGMTIIYFISQIQSKCCISSECRILLSHVSSTEISDTCCHAQKWMLKIQVRSSCVASAPLLDPAPGTTKFIFLRDYSGLGAVTLAAFLEYLDSIPSNHTGLPTICNSCSWVYSTFFWLPWPPDMHST